MDPQTAEHQQPSRQFRVRVLPLLQEEATILQLIPGHQMSQSRPMRGEQVLRPIPDPVVQPAPEAEPQHIQGQAPVRAAALVTHGRQHRPAVHPDIQDQAQDHGAVQATQGQVPVHGAARATQGQVQVQAIQDQARLQAVVQATQDQVQVHEAARVTQDQALLQGAVQAIQGRVQVHEAAQVTQDQVHHHVAARHHREGPAVRAGHPAAAQDPVTGGKKQFTYYFSLKHLSNS